MRRSRRETKTSADLAGSVATARSKPDTSAPPRPSGDRSPPDRTRKKVVAEDRNTRLTEIANRELQVLYLFIASGEAEHGLLVKGVGYVFDRLETESIAFAALAKGNQIGQLPAPLAWN